MEEALGDFFKNLSFLACFWWKLLYFYAYILCSRYTIASIVL